MKAVHFVQFWRRKPVAALDRLVGSGAGLQGLGEMGMADGSPVDGSPFSKRLQFAIGESPFSP